MMIAGHDQNVQNGQRNDTKRLSEMLDDSCCAILFFLHHANHFNYTIYVRVCLLKMLPPFFVRGCKSFLLSL